MTAPVSPWLSAAEAARRLGVGRATLYAYVSRGYLRSQPAPGSPRQRIYSHEDVERLRRRTEERRAPEKAAARALQWGLPILESSMALIDGRRLYYRGLDAARLARSHSLEEVAALLWTGRLDGPVESARGESVAAPRAALPFVARAQTLLASASARDAQAMDLRPAAVIRTGWRILRLLTSAATQSDRGGKGVAAALARVWRVGATDEAILQAALVLCADHELNVSAFTARCVASAGSHPYAVVIAGLSALEGPKHGGASARAESMLASLRGSRGLAAALDARLRRGEAIEGFGHPLYRDGDPRAQLLLELLRARRPSAERRFVVDVAGAAGAATGEHPNLDFGLAAVSRVLGLPAGAPLMLFALGRSVGWIGHALEQYATGQLIRPRARYVGVAPVDA